MQETDKHSRLKADIEEYSDMVLRIAVQNTRNFYDAQDITQEVFMRLMDNYDSVHGAQCHFEIRKDFETVDPFEYIEK